MMKKHIVVLSGAGISKESGLSTFRDQDGLWDKYPIEDVATIDAWKRNPQLVTDFYNIRRKAVLKAKPNQAHELLAKLERKYKVTILTQNIDHLHEHAGSSEVIHLHGSIFKMQSEFDSGISQEIYDDISLQDVAPDGGKWRPSVVWFGEPVPLYAEAVNIVSNADYFIVIGTSLSVEPVATIVLYAKKAIQKFYIDINAFHQKDLLSNASFQHIAKTATKGMSEVYDALLKI